MNGPADTISPMKAEPCPTSADDLESAGFLADAASPAVVEPRGRAARMLAGLLRFFGLWAGISGTYAVMCGACPFCGRPGCPAGIGVAGVFGVLGSLILTQGRHLFATIGGRLMNGRH